MMMKPRRRYAVGFSYDGHVAVFNMPICVEPRILLIHPDVSISRIAIIRNGRIEHDGTPAAYWYAAQMADLPAQVINAMQAIPVPIKYEPGTESLTMEITGDAAGIATIHELVQA